MGNVWRIIFFLVIVAIGAAGITYFYAMKREHARHPLQLHRHQLRRRHQVNRSNYHLPYEDMERPTPSAAGFSLRTRPAACAEARINFPRCQDGSRNQALAYVIMMSDECCVTN